MISDKRIINAFLWFAVLNFLIRGYHIFFCWTKLDRVGGDWQNEMRNHLNIWHDWVSYISLMQISALFWFASFYFWLTTASNEVTLQQRQSIFPLSRALICSVLSRLKPAGFCFVLFFLIPFLFVWCFYLFILYHKIWRFGFILMVLNWW